MIKNGASNHAALETTAPRVLVVDNDARTRRSYQELLKHWGYLPILAEGDGKALLENAKAKARANRCQLAITDMRLLDDFDEDDKSGLALIPSLEPAVCIIISGRGDLADARESQEKGAAGFVGKGEGPKKVKEKLESEALKLCALKRELVIEPVEILGHLNKTLFGNIPDQYHDQLLDGFNRLFPDAQTLEIERIGTAHISSDFSTVPRPRSVILRVREDHKQPVLVKFARVHKIASEIERFRKYIDGQLFGNFVPVLKGETILWDIGGIKLAYVGTLDQTFSNYFRNQPVNKIKLSLNNFFTGTWQPHYEQSKELENISLFKLYCEVWDQDWVERIKTFQSPSAEDVMGAAWATAKLINPIEWIKANILGEKDVSIVERTKTAVTHGDLHGDNMLVDNNHNIWVIDFERTRDGHILQDFIELESDIINRLPCTDENSPTFLSLCVAICKPKEIKKIERDLAFTADEDTGKAIVVISHLRALARECTGIADARQYLIGLLFNTVFRATLITSHQRIKWQQRALILASIICHRLERWDETWPPPEWPKLV